MKQQAILSVILGVFVLSGCASAPPASDRVDDETVKENAEKSMNDLKQEEDHRRTGEHY